MLKKRLYTALKIIVCCFAVQVTYAQTITIPQENITGQTDYSIQLGNGSFSTLVGLVPSISVQAATTTLPATSTGTFSPLPLSVVKIRLASVGGASVLGSTSEITLTNASQPIYAALLSIGGGAILNNYRIQIAGNAWLAGTYATNNVYTSTFLTSVTPSTQSLQINVPGFLTANTSLSATTLLRVNSLSFFRATAGISTSSTFSYYTSVPTTLSLRGTSGALSFSTTKPFNQLPATANINLLSANITDPLAGVSSVNLSTSDQLLTTSTGLPVVLTNNKSVTSNISITGANLKSNFVQAGTYTVPLVYTIAKPAAAYPVTLAPVTMNTSAQVLIDDLSELIVQDPSVSLTFNTVAAYKNGVTTQMPNHIKLSATVPYDVTVKASSNFLTSGTGGQIPVGVITIEGMPSQTGITPVVLSSTAQKIISSANPGIDRLLNLQYRVPAAQTTNLLGKTAGTYSTTITYTLVAP